MMSQSLAPKRPFEAPIVDQLSVRVVVDSRYERFLPEDDASIHGHQACRPSTRPSDDVTCLRMGPFTSS